MTKKSLSQALDNTREKPMTVAKQIMTETVNSTCATEVEDAEEKKSERITFLVKPSLKKQFCQIAKENRMSSNELANIILTNFVDGDLQAGDGVCPRDRLLYQLS